MESGVQPTERVGQVIAGKYALKRVLGAGGMGAVYEAEHAFTRRRVAVKLMHAAFAGSGVAADRFIREAQAPCRIGHPGIVDVLDAGRDEDGTLYLVLEMLQGATLSEAMEAGRLSAQAVTELSIELLDSLHAAHAAGFIHRDIKPENVFLADDGHGGTRVKLLDFGVAGMLSQTEQHLTMTGAVLGTPLYMSPEQAKGQRVDAATDLWAVGALMYTALSGEPPFQAETYNALIVSIATREHVPLSHLRPELPRPLLLAIERALKKDLPKRWRSADAMRNALVACLEHADPALDSFPPPRKARHEARVTADARGRGRRAPAPQAAESVATAANAAQDADPVQADIETVYDPRVPTRPVRPAEGDRAVPPAAIARLTGGGEGPSERSVVWPWMLGAAATVALAAGSLFLVRAERAERELPSASLVATADTHVSHNGLDAQERPPPPPPGRDALPTAQPTHPPAQQAPEGPATVEAAQQAPTAPAHAPTTPAAPTPEPAQGIGTEVLAKVVSQHQPVLEHCYQEALVSAMVNRPGEATKPIRIDVTMTVSQRGQVDEVQLRGAESRELSECLQKALERMPFPAASAATEVAFPIVFQPQVMGQ